MTTGSDGKEVVPEYWTPEELARRWGVDPQSIRRLCREGEVPGATKGLLKGSWRIRRKDVLRHEEEQAKKAKARAEAKSEMDAAAGGAR